MIDLVIVNPGASHGIYGELGDTLTACEPPLWCRLIAGCIRDRGFSVKIIDAEALQYSPADVYYDVLRKYNPRLICIAVYGHQPSASTQQMVGASAIATYLKNSTNTSHIPIIMVGGHVSALPERTLREESIDYACMGEGPVTIEGLLKKRDKADIPGLVWWDADHCKQVHINSSAPLVDMKYLHGNVWDLLPMNKYRAHNWQVLDGSPRQPYASIMTTLGCPYKCNFCMIASIFESNTYRMRDPFEVVEEIFTLFTRYGVKTFKIVDEMFVLNEKHYTEICKLLIERNIGHKINIWAYARIDTVKPHTLDLLRRAGFRWLALGIESGSKHVRDGAQKAFKNDDIQGIVRQIQQSGINVIANYIFGLPDDNYSSMHETLTLALELNTEWANFYCAMAYPGSKLYTEAVEKGWALPESWAGFSQHNKWSRPLDTNQVEAKEVLSFRDQAFQMYFTNPVYLQSVAHKFGDQAVEEIKKMTTYKLKRKLLEQLPSFIGSISGPTTTIDLTI